MVEVGDVGGRVAAPPDVDRLAERVEEAVAQRVPHMGVVDAVEARGLGREIRQLPRRRVRAGRVVEPGRDPVRALLHGLAEHRAHLDDVGLARLHVRPAGRREPQRRVADEERDVDAHPGVEAVEVLLHRRPVELDLGMAVEAGVHLDELAHVRGQPDRGVRQAVHADDLRRHALGDLRLVERVREEHQPGMAVQVDEPGRDDLAARVEAPLRSPDRVLDRRRVAIQDERCARPGPATRHADGGLVARSAGPVDDGPTGDQELEGAVVTGVAVHLGSRCIFAAGGAC